MAPMEGITGYIYRNTFEKYFGEVDKYFTPFIAPAKGRPLRHRELSDVLPEHNQGMRVIPQILTNQVEAYIKTATFLKELGYDEINLNMGCPSGTVVSKGKGAGMLFDTDALDCFLYGVFEADIMKVSVKTRIGRDFPEEFPDILEVYQKYPLCELIIHPRIRTDYYQNTPNLSMFDLAVENYEKLGKVDQICYNGDLFSVSDYQQWESRYPQVQQVMLGRGVIGNPFLVKEIREGNTCYDDKLFFEFHNELLKKYLETDLGAKNVLFKMKELWVYMAGMFSGEEAEKLLKKIRKTDDIETYQVAVKNLIIQ